MTYFFFPVRPVVAAATAALRHPGLLPGRDLLVLAAWTARLHHGVGAVLPVAADAAPPPEESCFRDQWLTARTPRAGRGAALPSAAAAGSRILSSSQALTAIISVASR